MTTNGSGGVSAVTRDSVTTNYARSVSGATATTTVTDALNHATTIVSDLNVSRPTAITDPLNHTTCYLYDTGGRLTRQTLPEGNYTDYTYDGRSNVTQVACRQGRLGLADIVTTSSFQSSCLGDHLQSGATTDGKGNTTDYTYDTDTGQSLTSPARAEQGRGASPNAVQLHYRQPERPQPADRHFTMPDAGQLRRSSDELKTTFAYDANGNVTSTSEGNGSDTLTATEARTYDSIGNLITVDGPLAGAADTTKYRYDAANQPVEVTDPDPDGTGALKMRRSG